MARKAKKTVKKSTRKVTRVTKKSSNNMNLLLLALALLVVVIAAYLMTMSSYTSQPLATPTTVQSPTPKAPVKTMTPLKK